MAELSSTATVERRSCEKHWWPLICREEARWHEKKWRTKWEKCESGVDVWIYGNESSGKVRKTVKCCGGIVVWNRSRGRAIMADRRRRKTWPDENDDVDGRTKLMNKAKVRERMRNTTAKMRRNHSNSLFRRIRWAIMADRCKTIGWARANDDDETERELFKFVVSPNRELWRLKIKIVTQQIKFEFCWGSIFSHNNRFWLSIDFFRSKYERLICENQFEMFRHKKRVYIEFLRYLIRVWASKLIGYISRGCLIRIV